MNKSLKTALLEQYQVRKSAAEKRAFRAYVAEFCREAGVNCAVEREKGLISSHNIVIGDLSRAQIVFTAHYDTCAVLPFPNLITPLSPFLFLLWQLALVVLLLAPALLAGFALGWVFPGWGKLGFYAVLLALCWQTMFGVSNRHTANDNTSGVAVLLQAVQAMPDALCGRIAIVLFDNEETGLLGSTAFFRRHRDMMQRTPLVNFDCVSDGENLLLAVSKNAADLPCLERMQDLFRENVRASGKHPLTPRPGRSIYPSDQMRYPYGIAVAALKQSRRGVYYMDRIHTGRDTVFEESNLDCLVQYIAALAQSEEIQPAANPTKPKASLGFGAILLISVVLGAVIGFLLAMQK